VGVDRASRWSLMKSEKKKKDREGSTERGGQCGVVWYLGFLR
jgi:hypothetical protein